jgi:uncharacterized repeat protein (TIGR03803 family)
LRDLDSPDGLDPLDPLFTDAENPSGQLIQGSDGALYGTTEGGGDLISPGTIYGITLEGTETMLYSGFDGDISVGSLIQSRDGNFYFTVSFANGGTIYRITPGGLYGFSHAQGDSPTGGLFEASDGNIYGTTSAGGSQDLGTIFRYQPDASFVSFESLYSFNGQNGSHPFGGITQGSDGSLYGSTFDGGTNNQGTLFKLTLPASLALVLLVLLWEVLCSLKELTLQEQPELALMGYQLASPYTTLAILKSQQ